jgi:2-polyprenyl-3-methyl-5-hydroxy-6-metoxy-1,4-benzoquinol methylase
VDFYSEISEYYDYVFPLSESKLNFFKKELKKDIDEELSILDIGTSTGSYAIRLVEEGYNVTGIDLNEEMLQECREKAKNTGVSLEILQMDMKDLNELDQNYDGIICIGNTLVHLSNLEEIKEVISNMYSLLNEEGRLIIQIVNYDRILEKDVKELPKIKREEFDLEFIREYKLMDNNKIDFKTTLKIEDKEFKNSISLYPLTSKELVNILEDIGFNNYKLYGSFNFETYEQYNSKPLILTANK